MITVVTIVLIEIIVGEAAIAVFVVAVVVTGTHQMRVRPGF